MSMNGMLDRKGLLQLAALACALILLLGRWSPARFLSYGVFPPLYLDIRIYLVILCFVPLTSMLGSAKITRDGLVVICMLCGLGFYILTIFTMSPVTGMNMKGYDYIAIKLTDVLILMVSAYIFHIFAQQAAFEGLLWAWVARIGLVLTLMAGVQALTSNITYDERLTMLGAEGGNFFSRIVGMAAVVFAVQIGRGERPVWLFAVGLGIASIVIILSGSRHATISTAIAVGLVLILSPRRAFMLSLSLCLVAAGVAILLFLPTETQEFLHTRYIDQLVNTVYLARRDILYDQVVAFWQSSPVFGHGIGSFSLISDWDYPHNLFMEVLSEFGIVGGILLFVPLIYFLIVSVVRRRYVDHCTLGVFVLFFIAAQVSGDIFDSRMVFLLPVLMATNALARYENEEAAVAGRFFS